MVCRLWAKYRRQTDAVKKREDSLKFIEKGKMEIEEKGKRKEVSKH